MKIKHIPEDFIVEELYDFTPTEGPYTYFLLKKRNYTTERAVQAVADALNVKRKLINYAGTKDKNAFTTQLCSVKGASESKLRKIKLKDIEVTPLGKGMERISLGQLRGNRFRITIRDAKNAPAAISSIPNYFDDQRFSTNNHLVGRALVKKDFRKAAGLLDEECIDKYLKAYPKNHIGALRTLPKKILSLFVHAYQSFLFNELLKEYISKSSKYHESDYVAGKLYFPKTPLPAIKLPLPGFGTDHEILKKEGIGPRDFIFRQFPELSSEGDMRDAFVDIDDMDIEKEDDNMIVSFSLPKGSYATIVIKALVLDMIEKDTE